MRCNCGIDPVFLADQHLIAEQVELTMVQGFLRRYKYQTKTPMPQSLQLGKGHITFWTNKLVYLHKRHRAVMEEVANRGFKPMDYTIDVNGAPAPLRGDWSPSIRDTAILRNRIIEKMTVKPLGFWRYRGVAINDQNSLDRFISKLLNSDLYKV